MVISAQVVGWFSPFPLLTTTWVFARASSLSLVPPPPGARGLCASCNVWYTCWMSERFWTSDLHFDHKNILTFTERANTWSTIEDMNEGLIERWNARVNPKDTVTVLGDFAMGNRLVSLPIGRRLNGRKILQPGNHDHVWRDRAKWKTIYEDLAGFVGIYGNHMTATTIGGKVVRQCHFPYRDMTGEYDDRYMTDHPERPDAGTILLHGHVHETWKIADHQINVGADVWDCYPVNEDELVEVCKDMGWMT